MNPFENLYIPPPYRIFISHAWTHSDDYDRLVNLITEGLGHSWHNLSVDKDKPLPGGTAQQLSEQLQRMIEPSEVAIIIAGMYVNHRDWIQHEVRLAQYYQKPIIGIEPFGAERIPDDLQKVANEMVGWRGDSICDAIRRWARKSATILTAGSPTRRLI